MIQPNELRIGNWVGAQTKTDCGILFSTERVDEINDIGVRVEGNVGYLSSEITPIPLTDELFEKSSFELFESKKKYWCHGSYMFVKGEKGFDVIHDYNWDEIAEPIEYVHQLQNLIFCLTGAEINIIL